MFPSDTPFFFVQEGVLRTLVCMGYRSRKVPIHMDSRIMYIQENLMVALAHMRHPTQPVCIWADAICINQNNPQDIAKQIAKMPMIYEHARGLISWLGPAQIPPNVLKRDLNDLLVASANWNVDDYTRQKYLMTLGTINWDNLWPIFNSDYWTRAWILQEVAARESSQDLIKSYYSDQPYAQESTSPVGLKRHNLSGDGPDCFFRGSTAISLEAIVIITQALRDSIFKLSTSQLRAILLSQQNTTHENIHHESVVSLSDRLSSMTKPACDGFLKRLQHCIQNPGDFAGGHAYACTISVSKSRDRLLALGWVYKGFNIVCDKPMTDVEVVLDIAEALIQSTIQTPAEPPIPFENDGLCEDLKDTFDLADVLLSWVPYGKTVLYPSKKYSDFFIRCHTGFQGIRTDTYSNTKFTRSDERGLLFTQCMYRATIERLFTYDDKEDFRKAMAARFAGSAFGDIARDVLLQWLIFIHPKPDDDKRLDRYLDLDTALLDDDDRVVDELRGAQSQGHHLGLLSDGNLFLGCGYSQPGDEVVLVEGLACAFIVRKPRDEDIFIFVERAAVVGVEQTDVITTRREELVIV